MTGRVTKDNTELIAELKKLRRSGARFTISYGWTQGDYEVTLYRDDASIWNSTGVLRDLIREANRIVERNANE